MFRFILFCVVIVNCTFANKFLYTKNNIFLNEYDPVSYIISNRATKGEKKFSARYKGVEIYFSSQSNKVAFLNHPNKYLPAYGGWCAYALTLGQKLVRVNPKSFKIIMGKTYLYYDFWFIDTLKKWNDKNDDLSQVSLANKNWEELH